MTTADFSKYKAIIVPDPNCGTVSNIAFLDDTKAQWSPAVAGNIILIGTDPTYHSSTQPGALTLIDDSVKFVASGNGTGLYFSLSCYYDSETESTVDSLSEFGTFNVRGRLSCYNDAHLVANSSALTAVDDADLSNWSCSVHEVFSSYPTSGPNGFEALAIAQGATGDGEQDFADGTTGIPYIISRGATPLGCGNGVIDHQYGEECDDGPANGMPPSLCSKSCKCLYGVTAGGNCTTNGTTTSTSSSSTMSSTSSSSNSSTMSSTRFSSNSSTMSSTSFSSNSSAMSSTKFPSNSSTVTSTAFSSSSSLPSSTHFTNSRQVLPTPCQLAESPKYCQQLANVE